MNHQLNSYQATYAYSTLSKQHFKGPVILDCILLAQYAKIVFENVSLTITKPDNCCKPIDVKNVALTAEGLMVIGQEYLLREFLWKAM